jgi:metallo-beta-lactamase class B
MRTQRSFGPRPWWVVLALAAGCATPPQPATEATVQKHLDAAARAAASDLKPLLVLCQPAPATRPPQDVANRGIAALINQNPPAPDQAFDNLYYVGAKWVSAWAIKTSEGIILIDALNNDQEAATLIEQGLRKVGLDPAQLKTIIVTHGHGDHCGGVNYLVQRYRPRVVMSALDWTMTETQLEFDTPLWGAPPKRDVLAVDGDRVTLGDTTVRLYLTPGHTKGTLSAVFDVRWGSSSHKALLWGGTAFNFGKDFERLDMYIASTERMRALAAQQQIDVTLSNHAGYDQSIDKIERLRTLPAGSNNPFVLGMPVVQRALTVMGECARATRDRFALQN